MYKFFLIIIFNFLILFLIYYYLANTIIPNNSIYSNNNINNRTTIEKDETETIIIEEVKNYKLNKTNSTQNHTIDDKFNIKTYDVINDNIIIHNKYKNELLNNTITNNDIKRKLIETKQIKKDELNSEITNNAKYIKEYEINKKLKKLELEINRLNISLKIDFNNFLNDYKLNKIKKNDINEIINKIKKIINKNLKTSITDTRYMELIKVKNNLLNQKIDFYKHFIKIK